MILSRLLSTFAIVAVTTQLPFPVGAPIGFRTEINRLHSMSVPFTGALVFKLNSNGILNGLYEADSIRPDPMFGHRTRVTGSISGNRFRLQIGTGVNALTVNGTVDGDSLSGSSMMRRNIMTFRAVRVHLQNPPVM